MKLIVGLGNPGKEYHNTRHNVGFLFLDYYINYHGIKSVWSKKFNGVFIKKKIFNEDVIFLKPCFRNIDIIA